MVRRRTRLQTVGQVASETGRLYREAREGRLAWQDAAAASLILHRLRGMIEAGDIEARLERLEQSAEIEPRIP